MKKVFDQKGDFEAYNAACKWLKDQGYSVGSMQREAPVAIKKGDFHIAKWRNLSAKDIAELDGTIMGFSKREGPVTVNIKD